MSDREPSDYVGMKLRCRERLRSQLEAEAQKAGHSLNQEIVQRLERTLLEDARVQEEAPLRGGWKTNRLCVEVEKAVRFFGVDCSAEEEPLARAILGGAISQILNERLSGWSGLTGAPGPHPRENDGLVTIPVELEERGRSRGALIGHQITLATRRADEEAALPMPEPAGGETLVQSAARLGLLGEGRDAEIGEAPKNSKKPKKQG